MMSKFCLDLQKKEIDIYKNYRGRWSKMKIIMIDFQL